MQGDKWHRIGQLEGSLKKTEMDYCYAVNKHGEFIKVRGVRERHPVVQTHFEERGKIIRELQATQD